MTPPRVESTGGASDPALVKALARARAWFSELAEGHFLHPRNVVAEGDLVRARILAIDGRARRLGLSLRTK